MIPQSLNCLGKLLWIAEELKNKILFLLIKKMILRYDERNNQSWIIINSHTWNVLLRLLTCYPIDPIHWSEFTKWYNWFGIQWQYNNDHINEFRNHTINNSWSETWISNKEWFCLIVSVFIFVLLMTPSCGQLLSPLQLSTPVLALRQSQDGATAVPSRGLGMSSVAAEFFLHQCLFEWAEPFAGRRVRQIGGRLQ